MSDWPQKLQVNMVMLQVSYASDLLNGSFLDKWMLKISKHSNRTSRIHGAFSCRFFWHPEHYSRYFFTMHNLIFGHSQLASSPNCRFGTICRISSNFWLRGWQTSTNLGCCGGWNVELCHGSSLQILAIKMIYKRLIFRGTPPPKDFGGIPTKVFIHDYMAKDAKGACHTFASSVPCLARARSSSLYLLLVDEHGWFAEACLMQGQ